VPSGHDGHGDPAPDQLGDGAPVRVVHRPVAVEQGAVEVGREEPERSVQSCLLELL
jgi:hypothetical protein